MSSADSAEDNHRRSGTSSCGLVSSLFSNSCRGRAEAFARRLHRRLKSLGASDVTDDEDDEDDEDDSNIDTVDAGLKSSSSNNNNNNNNNNSNSCVHESQPRNDIYYDKVNLIADHSDIVKINDKDNLNYPEHLYLSPQHSNSPSEEDNSDIFYDPESSETDKSRTEDFFDSINENEILKDDNSPYCSTLNISEPLIIECPLDKQCQTTTPDEIILKNDINIDIGNTNSKEDDDNDEVSKHSLRRCSSLKTGKTPPGTPGRKKIVRFADVLGLDLADVRTFLDEIPKIPNSAYSDLIYDDIFQKDSSPSFYDNIKNRIDHKSDKILVPLFQQPGGMPNFLDLIRDRFVCLENIIVQDPLLMCLVGTVRVKNIDYHKSVHIRYTLDCWKSFSDLQALYLNNSCDGFSDKFTFQLYCHTLKIGDKVELAVRYQCKGKQYWDNNSGTNYCFQCLTTTTKTTTITTTATATATTTTTTPLINYNPIVNSHHVNTHDWSPTFY